MKRTTLLVVSMCFLFVSAGSIMATVPEALTVWHVPPGNPSKAKTVVVETCNDVLNHIEDHEGDFCNSTSSCACVPTGD